MKCDKAWNLIGFPRTDAECRQSVRVLGGRTLYEVVEYNVVTGRDNVRLARLDTTNGLRQINRYVHPDALLEIVDDQGGTD